MKTATATNALLRAFAGFLLANWCPVQAQSGVAAGAAVWQQLGFNAQHSGRSPFVGPPTASVALKWSFLTGAGVSSTPAITPNGTLVFGSQDHNVYALDASGNLMWSAATGNLVYSSPALGTNNVVYVSSNDHFVYAFNASTGATVWAFNAGGGMSSSVLLGPDGTVYASTDSAMIWAINGTTGTEVWGFATQGYNTATPVIGLDGTVFVGSSDDNVVRGSSCALTVSA